MGATRYRWFDSGCCECVGHSCVSYGVNQAKCSGEAFTENEQEQENLNYMDLSEEELRRLEAEHGLLDEEDEEIQYEEHRRKS